MIQKVFCVSIGLKRNILIYTSIFDSLKDLLLPYNIFQCDDKIDYFACIHLERFPHTGDVIIEPNYYSQILENDKGFLEESLLLIRNDFKEARFFLSEASDFLKARKVLCCLFSLFSLVQGHIIIPYKKVSFKGNIYYLLNSDCSDNMTILSLIEERNTDFYSILSEGIYFIIDFNSNYKHQYINGNFNNEYIFSKLINIGFALSRDMIDRISNFFDRNNLDVLLNRIKNSFFQIKTNNEEMSYILEALNNYLLNIEMI